MATSPTRNTDGAFSKNPAISVGELKQSGISPGPQPNLLDMQKRDVRDYS